MRRNVYAFTLLELSFVFAIIGLLSIPVYQNIAEVSNLLHIKREIKKITHFLSELQTKSIALNRTIVCEIQKSKIISRYENSEKIKAVLPFHKQNILTYPKQTPKKIRLYPSGAASPFSLSIKNKYAQCSLIMSLRGRIRHVCA